MTQIPQGLLFVFGQCKPDAPLDKINEWYDNEHVPDRLAVPGITSAVRYRATDDEEPESLAIYDLATPDVLKSPEYLKLRTSMSDNERAIMSHFSVLQRRIYSFITQAIGQPNALPGKYLLVVLWSVQEEFEEEYNKWYDEEHMNMVAKIPGWLRGRRYKLVEGNDNAPTPGPPLWNHMVLHEFDNDQYLPSPEFQALMVTPRTKKVLATVKAFGKRSFVVQKVF